jgi:hypothetical protein
MAIRGALTTYGDEDPIPPEDTTALAASWAAYLSERPLSTDDPRRDLFADSARWVALLNAAHGYDSNLCDVLRAFRCLGAQLSRARIVRGSIPQGEYTELTARYLMPYRDLLIKLLGVV